MSTRRRLAARRRTLSRTRRRAPRDVGRRWMVGSVGSIADSALRLMMSDFSLRFHIACHGTEHYRRCLTGFLVSVADPGLVSGAAQHLVAAHQGMRLGARDFDVVCDNVRLAVKRHGVPAAGSARLERALTAARTALACADDLTTSHGVTG